MEKQTLRRVVVITAIVAAGALGVAGLVGWATGMFGPRNYTSRDYSFVSKSKGRGVAIDEQQTLDVKAARMIDIRAISADVRLITVADGDLQIRFTGIYYGKPELAPHLEAVKNGSDIAVRIERTESINVGNLEQQLLLVVQLPADYTEGLQVRTVSGDIEMESHKYTQLTTRSTSGDINLADLAADSLLAKTTSGDVDARGLATERTELNSVSGDLELSGFSGDTRANTTSGGINITYTAFDHPIDIHSVSGDITLILPQSAEFRLDAHSTSGDITCRFPIQLTGVDNRGSRNSIEGDVGQASHPLIVKTVSGDIDIEY